TRGAGAVFLAGQNDQRRALFGVIHRSVVNRGDGTVGLGEVAGEAAFGAGGQQVAQPDIGECAADHDFVVAAARAVGVEILRLDAVFLQIAACRRVLGDGAGRADVVGGD